MSKTEKKQLNFILINFIIFIWSIIIILLSYIWYKLIFPTKIVKDLPIETNHFIEFELNTLNNLEEILGKNIPWFFSYTNKIDEIKKWAVIFYKWEKIDALLTWSKRNSLNILKKLTTNKKSITESWSLILSLESPIPPCIHKWNSLFCWKNKNILEELLKDESKIRDNEKFLKIENNLYKNPEVFWFANLKNNEELKLTKEKFDSIWIAIRENQWQIEWIMFWNYKKDYKHLNFERKRNLNLEKYIKIQDTVASFWAREFEKQVSFSLEKYENNQSYFTLLWKWIIQGKLKEIFWENINLDDFLKVFSWEAVFSIFQENWKYEFEIIAEKTDLNKWILKEYEKNLNRFLPFKEVFHYKSIELTQITSNEENIEKSEEFFNWAKIYSFKAKEEDFWIHFIENKKLIRISSSKERIKKSLNSKAINLWKQLPQMPYSNDFWYINTKHLAQLSESFNMQEAIKIPNILKNKEISWASLSFEDWMQIRMNIENYKKMIIKNPSIESWAIIKKTDPETSSGWQR